MSGKRTALVALVGFTLAGVLTAVNVPWTDDARYYVDAAAAYGRWAERLLHGDLTTLTRASLDATFGVNREHPPVGKAIMAAGWLVLHRWLGVLGDVEACRAGVVLLWAVTCTLVLLWVRAVVSLSAGLVASLTLALMPRFLFHGHVETLDLPVAALLFASGFALWRCLERPHVARVAAATLLFGLALATKLNAPFFLVGAALYWLAVPVDPASAPGAEPGPLWRLPPLPLVLLSCAVLGPVVAWLLWPWLWFDTGARVNEYLRFHLQHYPIHFFFDGQLYDFRIAPWYAPLVMLGLTTPLPSLVLAITASLGPAAALLGRLPWLHRRDSAVDAHLRESAALRLGVFALLQIGVQLAAVCLPSVPKYGGVKLFLPVFPYLALLAGLAFERVGHVLSRRQRWALATVLLLPGALGVGRYWGAWLSYYNEVAGGAAGALEKGYERQYYDLAYARLASDLRAALPDGGRVAFLPNPKEYGPHLRRFKERGRLPRSIELATPDAADILVLTHERRWRQYPQRMAEQRSKPLVARYSVAGVALYSVYRLRD